MRMIRKNANLKEKSIEFGDTAKIRYLGTLENGRVFANSGERMVEVEVGTGKLLKPIEEALVGMKKGESKKIVIKPGEAYGLYQEELKEKIPRAKWTNRVEPKVGTILTLKNSYGQKKDICIVGVDEKNVTVDSNHPLAGKTLKYEIKIVDF